MTVPKTIYDDDSLLIDFPVSFPATGAITSLGAGTAEASADPINGDPVVAASVTTTGNTVSASWAAGTLPAGTYIIQLKITISGQVQVVAEERLVVRKSNR